VPFLLAEYEHLGASLLTNEDAGEKRVGVFLALIAAVTEAIGLGAERLRVDASSLGWVVLISCVVLLLYGVTTLRRIMRRNVVTTTYLNGLRRIRAAFIWRYPKLIHVLTFLPGEQPEVRERRPWWGIGSAGFLEVVATTNSLLAACAVSAAIWLMEYGLPVIALAAPATVVLTWLVQMRWSTWTYDKLRVEEECPEGRSSTRRGAVRGRTIS
jgi:hypothetical protein